MRFFDYIFYRVYKFYEKRDSAPGVYASGVLSVMSFFMLLSLRAVLEIIIARKIEVKAYGLPVILIIIFFNWYRYEKDFSIDKFEEQWGDEPDDVRFVRGWLIVTFIAVVFLLPLTVGIVVHNF